MSMLLQSNPWAIVDTCTIMKGVGVFDFDDLLEKLLGQLDETGYSGMFPIAMDDISGPHLTGVEADAIHEAIYEGADTLDPKIAAIVHAGPQHGNEEEYMRAIQIAIKAGAPFINKAIEQQNAIWQQKRDEGALVGKPTDKIPFDLPPAFIEDMGRTILDPKWKEGVWGPMNKDTPWQADQHGQVHLRIGNRDKENKFAESWARPYHEGLKALNPQKKNTTEYIDANKVRPNSVYVNHEAYKHAVGLMQRLGNEGRHGGNMDIEQLRQEWANDIVLKNHMPREATPLQHIFGIRRRTANVADAPLEVDPAQQMLEQQQAPVIQPQGEAAYGNYWEEKDLQTKSGKNLSRLARSNWGSDLDPRYGQQLLDAMSKPYGFEGLNLQDILARGTGRHRVDRLHSGMASYINEMHPGIVPHHIQDPSTISRPGGGPPIQDKPQVSPTVAPPIEQPPPAPKGPPVRRQEPAPPVRRQEPPPVVSQPPTLQDQTNINPPQEPINRLNANEPRPSPPQRAGDSSQFSEGWRGALERMGYAIGSGAASIANIGEKIFRREDIESALEGVQCELALQEDHIIKSLPHTPMFSSNASDIALMAGQIQRPASDVVAILNSRGDWREISKAIDIPIDYIKLVKVAFNDK